MFFFYKSHRQILHLSRSEAKSKMSSKQTAEKIQKEICFWFWFIIITNYLKISGIHLVFLCMLDTKNSLGSDWYEKILPSLLVSILIFNDYLGAGMKLGVDKCFWCKIQRSKWTWSCWSLRCWGWKVLLVYFSVWLKKILVVVLFASNVISLDAYNWKKTYLTFF